MNGFTGIWVPMVTPFRDGAVDLEAACRLAEHLLRSGVDGLALCCTTGEAATLSEAEQMQLLAAVQETVGTRCPLLFGLSGNDTAAVADAARRLDDSGVAGILLTAPYYVRPSQEGIRRHFEAVAEACRLPLLIYNIPYRTGVNIEPATLQALSANPRFVAIKESGGGNLEQLYFLINETPLKVLSGEDNLIFITACLGGHGAISAAAHIRPDLYVRMLALIAAGDLAAARRIEQGLRPLIHELFAEPNPSPVKAALAMQGLIKEELRLPMTPVSAACRDRLARLLAEVQAM